MNVNNIALVLAAGTTLLVTAPAFAQPPQWAPAHGWRAKQHHHYKPQRIVIVRPAPYYYVAPHPVVVYRPAPVVYAQGPVGPDVRVRFGLYF